MPNESAAVVIGLALITALPAILLALARVIDVIRGNKTIDRLDSRLNGRMDQLLQEREERGRLEGYQAGLQARRHDDSKPDGSGQSPILPG